MKPMRVYMDTSVFGGYHDKEFASASRRFFDCIANGRVIPLLSEALVRELEAAPDPVRQLLQHMMAGNWEPVELGQEATLLAQAYVQAGIVTEKYADDALHVALATVARAAVLASWNFRHLVNPTRIRAFNGVNTAHDFQHILIMTPADVAAGVEADHEEPEQDL